MDQINHGLHEECGVFGIYDHSGETDMASAVYYALYALQHRGQESCGIAINVDGVITGYRDLGLVNEVFTPQVMDNLPKGGKMAVAMYATPPAASGYGPMHSPWWCATARAPLPCATTAT